MLGSIRAVSKGHLQEAQTVQFGWSNSSLLITVLLAVFLTLGSTRAVSNTYLCTARGQTNKAADTCADHLPASKAYETDHAR